MQKLQPDLNTLLYDEVLVYQNRFSLQRKSVGLRLQSNLTLMHR